jgi:hypothetical protein
MSAGTYFERQTGGPLLERVAFKDVAAGGVLRL